MELQIRNLTKTYPGSGQALKGVNLTIPAGTYGLLGPTGAGKTTLMRILATGHEADNGSIRLGGIDVVRQKDAARKMLGYLPQGFGSRPQMSAERLLDQLGDAPLLLVDELPAGLTPAERLRFLTLLRDRGEHCAVLLSTQSVDDVRELCTRVAIIHDGRILLEAETQCAIDELHARIWSRAIAKEALPRVEREYAVLSTKFVDGQPVVRVYSNTAPAVGFERVAPDLEDVYCSALAGHIGGARVQRAAAATA